MKSGIASSDVVRSMMRTGFSHEEIYDVLTGIGLPGEQLQLVIDRVSAEFHDAGIEPRPSRLAKEVGRLFEEKFGELQHSIITRTDFMAHRLELCSIELEKIRRALAELGQTIQSTDGREKHLSIKSHKYKVGK